ncbi:hypothetical protein SAMN04487904_11669 [Actinopolyspora lacussalsi subsp. righensis]|uniref:Uncharacterized protein n=1 Tax=Actinopolyspora righensis TaxID=995060 RepID=A0A1I7CB71_9ACTN|nr:hypothetical protein [Actinopolyspora righensis]SFT96665.1 hypothetical protein SAMN04487904_11669 [Actinopolyspora righensis]
MTGAAGMRIEALHEHDSTPGCPGPAIVGTPTGAACRGVPPRIPLLFTPLLFTLRASLHC